MNNYIPADKLLAEIQRRKQQDITIRERGILVDIETAIASLQREKSSELDGKDKEIREELWEYFHQLQLESDSEFSPTLSIDEILSWLESTRQQSSWKPTKDELTAIEVALKFLLAHTSDEQLRKNVISVIEHLKQL